MPTEPQEAAPCPLPDRPNLHHLKDQAKDLLKTGAAASLADAQFQIARVKTMMARNPALHSAPLGYGKDGPLTWVAERRVPWESPSPVRLAMAE